MYKDNAASDRFGAFGSAVVPRPAPSRSLKLDTLQVEKPWGRHVIPHFFGSTGGKQVGEIWFKHPADEDLPLLVKYIFTSENLSIQVHPDDEQAQSRGLIQGKTECWYILDAEPGARIGLGLREHLSPEELRQASLDGSIERLVDWKTVSRNDFFFVPAGTVHAIGAGITLLEFQQNADVTYRLYDYGRPRELHLDDGIAVSKPVPFSESHVRKAGGTLDTVLVDGPLFSLVRATSADACPPSLLARRRWVMPLEGSASADGGRALAGECLLAEPYSPLTFSDDAVVLIGVTGALEA